MKKLLFITALFWSIAARPQEITTNVISDYHVISRSNVSSTLSRAEAVMNNTADLTDWLHRCKEASVLERQSDSLLTLRLVYETGYFFISDRFLITSVKSSRTNSTLEYRLARTERPASDQYSYRKLEEVKDFEIIWTFSIEDGQLFISYDMYLDPDLPLKSKVRST